jgi:GNAT superfamily N-acetyltransferase
MAVRSRPVPRFREVPCPSPACRRLRALREALLRRPLGLRLSTADCKGEQRQRHFLLLDADNRILAGVVLRPVGPAAAQLRQMFVLPGHQGRGHGRRLLAGVEAVLARDGLLRIHLHARHDAVGFYRRCGYVPGGSPFRALGIMHQRMSKRLPRPPS